MYLPLPIVGLISVFSLICPINGQNSSQIDLGYATHEPTYINTTASGTRVALYNNIRFAQPPLGDRRFRKAQTPPSRQEGVQNGRDRLFTTDCVSAAPDDLGLPELAGKTWGQEDCLFLNVWVPEGVRPGDNVPVIHWLHPSAFVFGSKDLLGDAMGLMDLIHRPEDRFIFVASNYRLGIYGWTADPNQDMDSNVGLHDGVAALEWTKQYISNFGGDPNKISAFGASAGGSILAMMLVARGGNEALPFQKVFTASAAAMPWRNVTEGQQLVFDQVLKEANCSSLDCLRNAPDVTLIKTNRQIVSDKSGGKGGSGYGPGIGLGPFPDGDYIPDALTVLLDEGRYNKDVRVMSGNAAADGTAIVPVIKTPRDIASLIRNLLPNASNSTVQNLRRMYPYPDSQLQLVARDWLTDVIYACNSQALSSSFKDRAQRYLFFVPPATHGSDLTYYFFSNNMTTPVANVSLARQFQSELLAFVRDEDFIIGTDDWPSYSSESRIANITLTGIEKVNDPWAARPNCAEILSAVQDERNGA